MEQAKTHIPKEAGISFIEKIKKNLSNIIFSKEQNNEPHRERTKKSAHINKKMEVNISILQKDLTPNKPQQKAYIRKYKNLPGHTGEEKYNWEAVLLTNKQSQLPENFQAVKNLYSTNKILFNEVFLQKESNMSGSGYRNHTYQKFSGINQRDIFRLRNGNAVKIDKRGIQELTGDNIHPEFGCSICEFPQELPIQ